MSILNAKNALVTTTFAVFVAGMAVLSSQSNASVTSDLQHCMSNNRSKTITCCNATIKGQVPFWLRDSGRNCASAVVCSGAGAKKPTAATLSAVPKKKIVLCTIQVFIEDKPSNDLPEPTVDPTPRREVTVD